MVVAVVVLQFQSHLHISPHQVDNGRGERAGVEGSDLGAETEVDQDETALTINEQVACEGVGGGKGRGGRGERAGGRER